MRGIYVLLIEVGKPCDIQVGKRRNYHFDEGYYAYVGSALGSLEKRVARHLDTRKKLYWHIDYLLNMAVVRGVIYAETNQKKECLMAQALSKTLVSKSGFGCSDCNCPSHLFSHRNLVRLRETVLNSFNLLNLIPSEIVP
jgi:Uri superfamily endonuclease